MEKLILYLKKPQETTRLSQDYSKNILYLFKESCANLWKSVVLLLIFTITYSHLTAGSVDVTHIPITKFSYPGRPITFKAVVKPIDTTVSSVTLMYKTAGEYSYTKFLEMTTYSSGTNYRCQITNKQDTLNDIEYRIKIIYTNAALDVIKFVPSDTDYALDVDPTETGEISTENGGSIILPDDDGEDLKYTGLIIPAEALYQNEVFGIDSFTYDTFSLELSKQNLLVNNNSYLNNNSVPVALYYLYKQEDSMKQNYAFRKRVQIVMRYFDLDNNGLVDDNGESELNLGVFHHDGLKWRYIESDNDIVNNTYTINTYSLGWYALFNKDKSGDNNTAKILDYVSHPSFSPLNGEIVEFGIKQNISDYVIKLIDFRGRIIRELRSNTWDGKNESGEWVESGVYIYQIKAGSDMISGMVCVVK